jgi:hypothetical protein
MSFDHLAEEDTTMRLNRLLWIVQGLLALVFLFAGGMKLVLPIEALTAQIALPGSFLRFIGVSEVLGALGLILPGLTRIRLGLTPIAATGLVMVMTGATVLTGLVSGAGQALAPFVVGSLAAFVARGRWQLGTGGLGEASGRLPITVPMPR